MLKKIMNNQAVIDNWYDPEKILPTRFDGPVEDGKVSVLVKSHVGIRVCKWHLIDQKFDEWDIQGRMVEQWKPYYKYPKKSINKVPQTNVLNWSSIWSEFDDWYDTQQSDWFDKLSWHKQRSVIQKIVENKLSLLLNN